MAPVLSSTRTGSAHTRSQRWIAALFAASLVPQLAAAGSVVIEPGQVIVHDSRPAMPAKQGNGYAHQIELQFPTRSLRAYHCDRGEYIVAGDGNGRVIGNCQLVLQYGNTAGADTARNVRGEPADGFDSAIVLSDSGVGNFLTFYQCRFDTTRRYRTNGDGGILEWRQLMSFTCNENPG